MCLFWLEWPVQYCFDGTWQRKWLFVNMEKDKVCVICWVSSLKFHLLLMSNISHNSDAVTSLLYYNLKPCAVLHFSLCLKQYLRMFLFFWRTICLFGEQIQFLWVTAGLGVLKPEVHICLSAFPQSGELTGQTQGTDTSTWRMPPGIKTFNLPV